MDRTTSDNPRPTKANPAPSPWGLGTLVALVFVAIAIGAVWYAAAQANPKLVGWHDGLDDAAPPSASNGAPADRKPMMVLYTADWCAACRQFKKNVLTDPTIAQQLGREFDRVKREGSGV